MSAETQTFRWWERAWIPMLLAVVTHLGGLWGKFVMDDLPDLVSHPVVGGNQPWWKVLSYNYMGAPLTKGANTIRPLTTLDFSLEWSIWGKNPFLFHVTSLLLFLALVWVVHRLLSDWLTPVMTFVSASLFAVLAIHVEVVAAIANRAEVWSLLLALLALRMALKERFLLASGFYFASLLGKESSILLPMMVAWALFCLHGWEGLREKKHLRTLGALFLTGVLFVGLRSLLLPLNVSGRIIAADNPLLLAGGATRVWMTFVLLGKYLWLSLSPTSLSADYTFSAIPVALNFGNLYGWLGLMFTVGNLALLAKLWKQRAENKAAQVLMLSIGGFVLSYALFSNSLFLIVTLFAERVFLAPSFWLCLWVGALLAWGVQKNEALLSLKTAGWGVLLLVFVWQSFWGYSRSREWKDELTLFQAQVRTQPANIKGRLYVARRLARSGKMEEALWHLAVAIQGRTRFPKAWSFYAKLDKLPMKQRIGRIPQLLAPHLPPHLVLPQFQRMARGLLGPKTTRVLWKMYPILHPRNRALRRKRRLKQPVLRKKQAVRTNAPAKTPGAVRGTPPSRPTPRPASR